MLGRGIQEGKKDEEGLFIISCQGDGGEVGSYFHVTLHLLVPLISTSSIFNMESQAFLLRGILSLYPLSLPYEQIT